MQFTYTATFYLFYNGHALLANNQTDTPDPDAFHKEIKPNVHCYVS